MTEATTTTEGETTTEGQEQQEETFTKADVEKIVRDRLTQQAKNKFGDYDELKTKAEGARTAEERIAALESDLASTKADAIRSRIAARFGISTESKDGKPSDADLFLTGSDEETLTAQAERLAVREGDQKKQGNVARKEGTTTTTGKADADLREFTRGLFGNTD